MGSFVLDVLDLLRSVGFSAAHWRELGQRLKPDTDLEAIAADRRLAQECLEAVISSWLRDGELDTDRGGAWEVLASAVERCRGGGRNVAAKIRQRARSLGSPGSRPIEMGMEVDMSPVLLLTGKPTLSQLGSVSINGTVIRVIQEVAPHWEALALCLNLSRSTILTIKRDHSTDAMRACQRMLGVWLEGREGGRHPLTWETLAEALKESEEFPVLANNIVTLLNNLEEQ